MLLVSRRWYQFGKKRLSLLSYESSSACDGKRNEHSGEPRLAVGPAASGQCLDLRFLVDARQYGMR